jgi:hypothetical protein
MDVSAAGPLVTNAGAGRDAAVPGVPSGPGWLLLRDCPLGGGGPPVALALLHPKIGVALVDFVPAPRTDAADRLRRALDARRFPAIFGGYPPIVGVVLPADRLPELGQVLSTRFKAEPRSALEGGEAWLPTARAALEAKPEAADSAAAPGAKRRDVPPWRAAVFIFGAAASGAALAAVVLMPPGPVSRNGLDAARTVATAAPQPAAPPVPRPAPSRERVPVPEAAVAPPAPATNTGDGGAGTAFPQEAGGDAPPPPAAGGEDRLESPAPPSAPVAPATADLHAGQPWLLPPAAAEPSPTDATEEAPARLAGNSAGAPATAAPRRPANTADRRAPPHTAAALPADTAGGKRCRDILVKTTLGEDLSDGDKGFMRRRCQQPRD